jgi:hypothetical protein
MPTEALERWKNEDSFNILELSKSLNLDSSKEYKYFNKKEFNNGQYYGYLCDN